MTVIRLRLRCSSARGSRQRIADALHSGLTTGLSAGLDAWYIPWMFTRLTARRWRLAVALAGVVMAIAALTASVTPILAQGAPIRSTPPIGQPDLSKLPKTPTIPTTFEGLFAARDHRSVSAIGYLRCMEMTVNALRTGALGNVSRDWSITCIEQGTEWRGVFGQLTDSAIDVKLQLAIRGKVGVRTTAPVDTARVSGLARALLRGLAAPLPGGGKYEFTPVPIAQDKFIEVWFLPVPSDPTKAIVGGDSLIQMNAEGGRELGHGRNTPPIRAAPVPLTSATWTIESLEERIPTVSELMVARMSIDLVPEVHVRTRQYDSMLRRGTSAWTHTRR